MTIIKKATFKVDNGYDYDEIMFKTTADQVVFNDSMTLQQKYDSNSLYKGFGFLDAKEATNTSNDVITISRKFNLCENWRDLEVYGTDLENGSYILQIQNNIVLELWTGMMSWMSNTSISCMDSQEIILHKAGASSNDGDIYLRTIRNNNGLLNLQIKSSFTKEYDLTFKFKKLI